MKPFNATATETLLLTEGSRINTRVTYEVGDVATDISGGSFKLNFLDKSGGTIMDSASVTYSTDGTDGDFDIVYEIADLAVLLAAHDDDGDDLPGAWEFFFSSDGTDAKYKIWADGPIEVARSGS